MILSVIIPAFNEIENLRHTLPQLEAVFSASKIITDFELLVVDDHSSEPLFEELSRWENFKIHCIRLSRRSGSHIALRAGLAAAQGDAILCISADGQEDPASIPLMIEKWNKGNQVVWGLRRKRCREGLLLKTFSMLFYKLLSMLTDHGGQAIDLNRADFYLLDRKVVDNLNQLKEQNTSLFGLIAWIGYQQDYVEYNRRERLFGHSKWKFRSRMRLAKDWIIAFSGLPLKTMTVIGFSVAFLGMLYSFWVIGVGLLGKPVPGWSSLMVVVLVLGGLQMAMLGVIGEYLWRTLEETRRRSLYFIERSTLSPKGEEIRRHTIRVETINTLPQ